MRRAKTLAAVLMMVGLVWSFTVDRSDVVAHGAQKRPGTIRVQPKAYTPEQESDESDLGRRYYEELNCADCHAIAGEGGTIGPPLDGVAGRRSEEFLVAKITDPQDVAKEHPETTAWEPSGMRHPRASPEQVHALVAYLRTLPNPPGGFLIESHNGPTTDEAWRPPASPYRPDPQDDVTRRGRLLYHNLGCAACHAIGRYGGEFGPRLDGIGGRRSRAFIEAHISNPRIHVSKDPDGYPEGTLMPRLELTADEIEAVTNYLLTLPDLGG